MNVIYALFDEYDDARAAVRALLDEDFDETEFNALVLAKIAKDHMDVDLSRAGTQVSEELGGKPAAGLDLQLAKHQPLPIPELGEVYASGELAMMLAQTAAEGDGVAGLRSALEVFVPADNAQAFADGVDEGGLLLWVRTEDERGADAVRILRLHHGKHVGDYVG